MTHFIKVVDNPQEAKATALKDYISELSREISVLLERNPKSPRATQLQNEKERCTDEYESLLKEMDKR